MYELLGASGEDYVCFLDDILNQLNSQKNSNLHSPPYEYYLNQLKCYIQTIKSVIADPSHTSISRKIFIVCLHVTILANNLDLNKEESILGQNLKSLATEMKKLSGPESNPAYYLSQLSPEGSQPKLQMQGREG